MPIRRERGRMQVITKKVTAPSGDTRKPFALKSAYTIISPGEEGTFPLGYDLYVCNPTVNLSAAFMARMGSSLRTIYGTSALIFLNSANAYWVNLIGQTTGADYWHTDLAADSGGAQNPGNRLTYEGGVTHWHIKPSASLGARLSAYVVSAMPAYFHGAFSDESTLDIPDHYWTAWKTAADGPQESERPAYEKLWDEMIYSWTMGLKGIWQKEKLLIPNSKGGVHPIADGHTTEASHIHNLGLPWAMAAFTAQSQAFDRNPWRCRYIDHPHNIAWNHGLQVPGLVLKGLVYP